MKNLTTYISIFILLLALGACGGDNATGPGPDPDPDPDPPTEVNYETLDITVTLPEGSDEDLSQTTVMSLSVESEVTADGQSAMAFNEGTTQMAYVFDAQDNLLMAGFVSEDQPEINIETTTEVFFYFGLGTILLPSEIKDKFIAEVRTIPGFDEFAAEMEQLFLTNPRMFQDGAYTDQLVAKISELRERDNLDIPSTQLQVDGADIRSGLQLADVDFEHFTITNNYRRRAHTFIYKTAFKDENGIETVLKKEIAHGDVADKDQAISATGAIRETLGVLADWAGGKGADFAAVTTDPIQLLLAGNESEATYKVRVVGPGTAGVNRDFGNMSFNEEEKFLRLQLETFTLDFFLPLVTDLGGNNALLSGTKLSKKDVDDLVDKIINPALSSVPAAYDKVKEGKFGEGLTEFIRSFTNNVSGGNFDDLFINVFEFLGERAGPDVFVQTAEPIKKSAKKLAKLVGAVDIGLKAIDYGRMLHHIESSFPLEEWTVKAKSSDVTLTPKEQTTIPFDRKELEVITKTELSDGAAFQYEWSTSGKYGILSDERGHSGTSFTSSLDKVTYQSRVQSDELSEGENIEEVYVTVSIKQGNRITKVNTDTARINVQPFKYEIKPDGITMQGGSNVKLNLERVDGFNDIGTSDVFNYKVIWSTGGAHGQLEGSQTTVTKYNSDSITYEALDEDVEKGIEDFTARIYFRSKDKTEWNLLDEAEGQIKIENDDNKIIMHKPLEVLRYNPSWGSCGVVKGIRTFVHVAAAFEPVENAKSYSVTILDYGRFKRIGPARWNAGQPVPRPYKLDNRLTGNEEGIWNGKYHVALSGSSVCSEESANNAESFYRAAGGYAEIIIELEND